LWVISMSSTKGGGGKTTLAAHLAVEAVKQKIGKVAVIDTDPQASLAGWWNLREAETPAFVQTTLKDLPEQLKALMDTGYQVVVIDTPGADVSFTRSILKHCDLAIVPSRPSPLDLGTLNKTVEMIEAEEKPVMFILNAVTPRTRISAQAMMALSQHGPVAGIVHQRTDYAASMTDGRVAGELDPSSKSADEISQLWKAISAYLRKHAKQRRSERVSS
jgi:chromosome partitioning protein